jgi:SAM-dependent methyltransferase
MSARLEALEGISLSLVESVDKVFESIQELCGDTFVVVSILNPLLDLDFLLEGISQSRNNPSKMITPVNGTLGTSFDFIITGNSKQLLPDLDTIPKIAVENDNYFKIQIDVGKFKRLKLLLRLLEIFPEIIEMSTSALYKKLHTKEFLDVVLAYGEAIELRQVHQCLVCEGKIVELARSDSHPFIGFVPIDVNLYLKCTSCGLVISKFIPDADQLYRFYDEFDFLDFQLTTSTGNPYGKTSPRLDLSTILDLIPDPKKTHILDLGGGTGRFSLAIKSKFPEWVVTHSDFEAKALDQLNELGINTLNLDLNSSSFGVEVYDVITAWEVIEHIHPSNLHDFICRIKKALKPGGVFLLSTPDLDSPMCKVLDFWACCYPFHTTVMSKSWLERWIGEDDDWNILPSRWNSDLLNDWMGWRSYSSKLNLATSSQGMLEVIDSIWKQVEDTNLLAASSALGSEIVFGIQKKIN